VGIGEEMNMIIEINDLKSRLDSARQNVKENQELLAIAWEKIRKMQEERDMIIKILTEPVFMLRHQWILTERM